MAGSSVRHERGKGSAFAAIAGPKPLHTPNMRKWRKSSGLENAPVSDVKSMFRHFSLSIHPVLVFKPDTENEIVRGAHRRWQYAAHSSGGAHGFEVAAKRDCRGCLP